MFARWWADQLETNTKRVGARIFSRRIEKAINARRVMVNDITGLNNNTSSLPYLIWWPLKPASWTLLELAKNCPDMTQQIAIACIFCDYEDTYSMLEITPHMHIWMAAKQSPNPFYLADVEKRAAAADIDVACGVRDWFGQTDCLELDLEPTTDLNWTPLRACFMDHDGSERGTYFGEMPDSGVVERYVWQSPDMLRKLEVLCGEVCNGDLEWLKDEELPEIGMIKSGWI